MFVVMGVIEWPQVSALAACSGVIVAMIFNLKNLANTWLSNSAKMVLELGSTFNSEEMRGYRSRFAQAMLTNRSGIDLRNESPVLGFLEEVGYMTRRGVLDKGMVWNSFFWYLEHYYIALTAHPDLLEKARTQTKSTAIYREIRWLYKELCKISIKEKGIREYIAPHFEEIQAFLKDESALVPVENPKLA